MAYITVRYPVRHRSVALVTRDPELYHELAGFLRERHRADDQPFAGRPDPGPGRCGSHVEFGGTPDLSPERPTGQPRPPTVGACAAAVRHALESADPNVTIVVGLDPGPRPGTRSSPGRRPGRGRYSNPPSRPERSRASFVTGSRLVTVLFRSVGETRPHGIGS